MDLYNKVRNAILESRGETGLPKSTAEKNKQYIEVTHLLGHKKRVPVHPSNAYKALNRYRNDPSTKSARIVSEDVDQLDELSKDTMKSYVGKATKSLGDAYKDDNSDEDHHLVSRRAKGVTSAMKKVLSKEEAEELDELSRETVGSYSKKAKSIADNEGGKDRTVGRALAGKKRWGGTGGIDAAKVPATEAVKNPYAVGMAAAEKQTGDTPPLKKSTIVKGHEIAKKIEAKEEVEDLEESVGDYKLKKTGTVETIAHPQGKPAYDVHHNGNVIGDIRPSSGYKDKKIPGKRYVASRKDITTYSFNFKHGHGPKSHEMGYYVYGDHPSPKKALEQMTREHQRHLAKLTKEESEGNEMNNIDEARGRPPKEGSEAWKKAQTERKKDPAEHIINRMGQASTNMTGGQHITYDDGKVHRVSNALAAKTLTHYRSLKPAQKADFQAKIAKSHQHHLDALAGK